MDAFVNILINLIYDVIWIRYVNIITDNKNYILSKLYFFK